MATKRFNTTSFSRRMLGSEDRKAFNQFMNLLHHDIGYPDEIDSIEFLHMELVALYLVRLTNAMNAGNIELAEYLDRMVCLHLKPLNSLRRGVASAAVSPEVEKTRG
ncbi:MAG: hypothetical protein ACYC64_10380 [Armatimonadota bacterium]